MNPRRRRNCILVGPGKLINMTKQKFYLYDDSSGEPEIFYPSPRQLVRHEWAGRLFPREVYYVFNPEMKERIDWCNKYGGYVVILECLCEGHGGLDFAKLRLPDTGLVVRFSRYGNALHA